MKRLFFTILLLSLFSVYSEELVRNKNFKILSPAGFPADFQIFGKGQVKVLWNNGVNSLEFDLKKKERRVIKQNSIPLKKGCRYELSWWDAGDKSVSYMVYIEKTYSINGIKKWKTIGNVWRSPGPTWNHHKFSFVYNSDNPNMPYLAVQIKGPGKFSLKNFDLKCIDAKSKPRIDISKVTTRSDGTNKVFHNKDNILTINGKKFFPLYLWGAPAVPIVNELFQQMKSNGLNTFFGHLSPHSIKLLELAHKNDIKVILHVPKLFWIRGGDMAFHNVYNMLSEQIVNHPALLGYFLGDELLWSNRPLKPVIEVYNFLKKVDPNHPVFLNAAPRNTIAMLAKYGQACDIYGVDIYPVGSKTHSDLDDKSISSVGKYAARMLKAVGGKKPVCMALQGFSWGELMSEVRRPDVYPSQKQIRFMTYDSIINRATLISWWGTFSANRPEIYDNIFEVSKELYQITDILTSPESKTTLKCSNKEIEYIIKASSAGEVIIAANTSPKEIKAEFEFAVDQRQLFVWFEKRQVALNAGTFSDSFKPYDVHVYSLQSTPAVILPKYESSTPCFFRETAKKCITPYKGKANWIWFPGKDRTPNSSCKFTREFIINKPMKEAVLIATADDSCIVQVNDKIVGRSFNWNKAVKISLIGKLKQGKNKITISASDAGQAPCGMLCDLFIKFTDGSDKRIISDSGWISEDKDTGKRENAQIIALYGKGPWGNGVKTF